MCKCTPEIKTPFCGKGNCQWPDKDREWLVIYHNKEKQVEHEHCDEYIVKHFNNPDDAFLYSIKIKDLKPEIYKRTKLKVEII
jgi:hypothetical protein